MVNKTGLLKSEMMHCQRKPGVSRIALFGLLCGMLTVSVGWRHKYQWTVKQAAAAGMTRVVPAPPSTGAPLFSFGIVADIQYADKDSRPKYYYRDSLINLENCVSNWNQEALAFVVELGDFVDLYGTNTLETIMPVYCRSKAPRYFVVGNHDNYIPTNDTETVLEKYGIAKDHYDFTVQNWRFITLNNSRGYLPADQCAWLSATLKDARRKDQKAIVFCHYLCRQTARAIDFYFMKNKEEVGSILESSGNVVAYFSGHFHPGGYRQTNNVHYVSVPGMIAWPQGVSTYGIVDVHPDRLVLRGKGKCPRRVLPVANPVQKKK